jgi:hypothetical protein
MGSVPPLPSFMLMVVSGWVHRPQLLVIEFLQAENRSLKERLRGKRIRFTDIERALPITSQYQGLVRGAGTSRHCGLSLARSAPRMGNVERTERHATVRIAQG